MDTGPVGDDAASPRPMTLADVARAMDGRAGEGNLVEAASSGYDAVAAYGVSVAGQAEDAPGMQCCDRLDLSFPG